jgi:UrcA family protein
MKSFLKFRSLRNSLLTAAVITAATLPVSASASVENLGVSYEPAKLDTKIGQLDIYNKLKDASRKLCRSSDLRLAGSLRRSVDNKECYEGTLTAAVDRLDNNAISKLHSQ